MEQPLVSYLMTVYNKEKEVPDTIDSVLRQGDECGAPFELIVSDDASTDRSVQIIKEKAQGDRRIRLLVNDRNLGPSARINQAAQAACGKYFVPLDGDDFLAPRSTAVMLDILSTKEVDAVFGRSMRGGAVQAVEAPSCNFVEDPLVFCARRQLTHMGFMVKRELWFRAGGADRLIFIQDQSLPLRLCAAAGRIAYLDAVLYVLRARSAGCLSNNKVQQHHDRFLAAYFLLQRSDISCAARRALKRVTASALWKLHRDTARLPLGSRIFLKYLAHRILGLQPSSVDLDANLHAVLAIPGVRRIKWYKDELPHAAAWRGDEAIDAPRQPHGELERG